MTNFEAKMLLIQYNQWRRRSNDDPVPMPSPQRIGESIDKAIEALTILDEEERK